MLQVVLFTVLALMASVPLTKGSNRIEVQIPQGRLSGVMDYSSGRRPFWSFKGIPYAQPPVGPLRFKDPEPAGRWQGVRDASSDPPICTQQPFLKLVVEDEKAVEGVEDCLYMNVYSPKLDGKLPVMVWIHGGGFFGGRSSMHPPHNFLDRDIVYVVFQYRVGIFGFMSTEDKVIPGNFGLKDQTLALRWVRDNIGYFGGDRDQVTLVGSTAGSAGVHFQMLTPYASGLFHRAILESGSAIGPWALEKNHGQLARRIGDSVGCSLAQGSEAFLYCMQQVPANTVSLVLSGMFEFLHTPLLMVPRVDGDFIPASPEYLMACGKYNRVPLITGCVRDMGGSITKQLYTRPEVKAKLLGNFSHVPGAMFFKDDTLELAEYQARKGFESYVGNTNYNDNDVAAVTQVFSDAGFIIPQDVTAILNSRFMPTYVSELQFRVKNNPLAVRPNKNISPALAERINNLVTQADDIFLLFDPNPLGDPVDRAMRNTLITLWTNFVIYGDPTPGNYLGFKWEKLNERYFKQLAIRAPQPSMENDPRAQRRNFWLNLPAFEEAKQKLINGC